MADPLDISTPIDPLVLRRLAGLPPLVPAGLATGREIPIRPLNAPRVPAGSPGEAAAAAPAVIAPPAMGGLTPRGLDLGPEATGSALSASPARPTLRPVTLTPPDPKDPQYQLHGAKKVGLGILGGLAGLGGHLDVAASLNPYQRALAAYNRSVDQVKTNLGLEDTASQIEERRAQARRADAAADKPESIEQELATATMDAISRGTNPTEDPKVKDLIAVRNAAADKTGGPKVKDVKADDQGNAIAVMEDGTTKQLGFKEQPKAAPETTNKLDPAIAAQAGPAPDPADTKTYPLGAADPKFLAANADWGRKVQGLQIKKASDEAASTESSKALANAPTLEQATKTTSSGMKYVDLTNLTGKVGEAITKQALAAGIPVADKNTADSLEQVDIARANQDSMLKLVSGKLATSPGERIYKGPENKLASAMQTDETLAAMGTFRNAAIQAMRAVAGSKGLRINKAEVELAIDNDIPKMTDTWDVAAAKVKSLQTFLGNIERVQLSQNRQGGTTNAPAVGAVEGGYRFKGGDPSKKENWEKAK